MKNPILGHLQEHAPRFGLWLDDSRDCQAAVHELLSDGYDCAVALNYWSRCARHAVESLQPVILLSQYATRLKAHRLGFVDCADGLCTISEAFFPPDVVLWRHRVAGWPIGENK